MDLSTFILILLLGMFIGIFGTCAAAILIEQLTSNNLDKERAMEIRRREEAWEMAMTTPGLGFQDALKIVRDAYKPQ